MGVETGRAVAPTPMGGAGGELPGSGALGGSKVIFGSRAVLRSILVPGGRLEGRKSPPGHPVARGPVDAEIALR